jgi:hypothetical protein
MISGFIAPNQRSNEFGKTGLRGIVGPSTPTKSRPCNQLPVHGPWEVVSALSYASGRDLVPAILGGQGLRMVFSLGDRRRTHTGRPPGTGDFIQDLEKVTHRRIVLQKRGRIVVKDLWSVHKTSETSGCDQAGGHAARVPLESAKRFRGRIWGGLEAPEDLTQIGSASHFEIAWSTASKSAPMSRSGLRSSDTQ